MKRGKWWTMAVAGACIAAFGTGVVLYSQRPAAYDPGVGSPATPTLEAAVASPRPAATATTGPTATATSGPTAPPTPVFLSYRFSDHTVLVSSDGSAWQERPQRFAEKITSLSSPASNPVVVYILTTVPLSTSTELRPVSRYTVQASRDGELTWQAGATDQTGGCYMVKAELQVVKGPAAPESLIVATQCVDNPSDARGFGLGAHLSTDGGRSFAWSASGDGIQLGQTREGGV
jgi:hypothetical protein